MIRRVVSGGVKLRGRPALAVHGDGCRCCSLGIALKGEVILSLVSNRREVLVTKSIERRLRGTGVGRRYSLWAMFNDIREIDVTGVR